MQTPGMVLENAKLTIVPLKPALRTTPSTALNDFPEVRMSSTTSRTSISSSLSAPLNLRVETFAATEREPPSCAPLFDSHRTRQPVRSAHWSSAQTRTQRRSFVTLFTFPASLDGMATTPTFRPGKSAETSARRSQTSLL